MYKMRNIWQGDMTASMAKVLPLGFDSTPEDEL